MNTKFAVFAVLVFMLLQSACIAVLRDTANHSTLRLDFEANRDRARVGEPIYMRFSITNVGEQTLVFESKDTPVMDIVVSESGGGALLSWSELNPDKVSYRIEWKRGESKVIELTWTPRQEDIYSGSRHDIDLDGYLNRDSKPIQSAGVRICASDVCR